LRTRHLALLATTLIAATAFAQAPDQLPLWAYPSHFSAAPSSPAVRAEVEHLPGSKASFTKGEIGDLFVVPDWYPDIHPPMPDVVSHGSKPDVYACGHCHLPNGQGRPENASVTGLSAAYIVQQMADFKNGLRKSSDPDMLSVTNMVKLSKSISDEDVKAAAAYFSSFKLKPWIRVVEVEQVIDGGGSEPIGDRVIEVSENLEHTELRDPTSGFIAYVPKASLEKGKDLVTTGGNGKTMQCTMCHGPDLKGSGNIPSISGRSPSQMARQLIDFQTGARNGSMAPMMKGVAAKLTTADIVAITGYLASQAP
jgi:cytochrome c553